MKDEERPEIKALEKQSKKLADVAGRVVAPLVGLIALGPIGAIAGGIVGTVVKYGLEDFLEKFLTSKEVKRIGTSAEYMIKTINRKLNNGEEVNEMFFQEKDGKISDAEEIFESVLVKIKNEYQKKKEKYLSNIFVNATFDKTISTDNINQILSTGDRLTYRQLCLISLIGKNAENQYQLGTEDNRENFNEIATEELRFLLNEAREMQRLGIINSKDRMGLFNYTDPAPAGFCLQPLGIRIFQLMGLTEMHDQEYTFIGELR